MLSIDNIYKFYRYILSDTINIHKSERCDMKRNDHNTIKTYGKIDINMEPIKLVLFSYTLIAVHVYDE